MATILLPLPTLDFDPTEVAVSWRIPTSAGHEVVFATPEGQPAEAAWVVRDGNYISARWPGDVHTFARTFAELLDAVSSC
jgi:hypothetical protein